MENNYGDFVEYKKTFGNLIDETSFELLGNQGSQVNFGSFYPKSIKFQIQKFYLPKAKWHPCNMLWNRFIVTYEGYLTICCIDFENKLIYGDLNKQSLKACWNNKKIKRFRKIHKFKQFVKMPMCYDCDIIKRNDKININKELVRL
jgi:radical SAM protein with 4Fe4S-binding SPASM domain